MRPLSAGDGYRYLLKSIAAGDGNRDLSTPLTRYYQQAGTPPGFWLGRGLPGLGGADGRDITSGDRVGETQLRRLLGEGCDPVTGAPLGARYSRFKTADERIARRVGRLDPGLSATARTDAIAAIEAEERARRTRRAVAGYDYTFSVPKSVSVLWGVADAGTQALIAQAHHDAIGDVLDLMERQVAATRTGRRGIMQVETRGLIATAFDHHDSRSGDPQLHTHVVIANKVQGPDGKWRTLDGRPMHAAVVALSEHYNAVLADRLAAVLGTGWRARDRGRDRNPSWEIDGVPDELIAEFSQRTAGIEAEMTRIVADYVAAHGRHPSKKTLIGLRQQATLATRPDKELHSLSDLTSEWRHRASELLDQDAPTWAQRLLAGQDRPVLLRADDLTVDDINKVAAEVIELVSIKRSTWRRWNLYAEASRQTMDLRFASAADRERVIEQIVNAAQTASLALTPPPLTSTPEEFRRSDGTSMFRPAHHVVFSSEQMLAAEDRLLTYARASDAPALGMGDWGDTYRQRANRLGSDQQTVVELIACSGRRVDVLVGPAGTGKTTTLAALRAAWEHAHGDGSVIGLAPTAAAAQVLADDLGIECENTAKWLHEHRCGRWNLEPGQLVIVDEASLAGTLALDRLVSHAADQGAKVLLVGDWAQLTAVDAGGAFGLITREVGEVSTVPELTDVRRLTHPWEKTASLRLRVGDPSCLESYDAHDRIRGGDYAEVLESAYQAWRADHASGLTSVLIADTRTVVSDLNSRARNDLILDGAVEAGGVLLRDGNHASVGDRVITRLNDRDLRTSSGSWVKNGDRWQVTTLGDDGSLTLRRTGTRRAGTIVLPAAYVAKELDLGYAITAHRAQGSTVDTAHVLVAAATMIREALYVAMTRGRHANTAWVATDSAELEEHQHAPDGPPTGREVLAEVLARSGRELSAHEMIEVEQEQWTTIAHLADQYDIVARAAQAERWAALVANSDLAPAEVDEVLNSETLSGLIDTLRHADAVGHHPAWLLDRAIRTGHLADTEDLTAVLAARVSALANRSREGHARSQRHLIAGLVPAATSQQLPVDMNEALNELADLIEQRATALAQIAVSEGAPWLAQLGPIPTGSRHRQEWLDEIRVIAACADRHNLPPEHVLNRRPDDQRITDRIARRDLALARAAARRARAISNPITMPRPATTPVRDTPAHEL